MSRMHTGGKYRGPGDIVPPGRRGAGRTPGPGPHTGGGPRGPMVPGRPAPQTGGGGPNGGPGGPGVGRAPGRTGGIVLQDDLSRWVYWWEFNKDPYLQLRKALEDMGPTTGSDGIYMGPSHRNNGVDLLRPTESMLLMGVVPDLRRALEATNNRDITSSCMVALAKIGLQPAGVDLLAIFRKRLRSHDQEIRESAALAMGISQLPAAMDDLVALLLDTPTGAKLVDRNQVQERTRAFAAYGVGLLAHATSQLGPKQRALAALRQVLETDARAQLNLKVACINGMRLLQLNGRGSEKSAAMLRQCLEALEGYYRRDLGPGEQLVQAHVPPAIATLLGPDSEESRRFADLFAGELNSPRRRSNAIYQSAALALGKLARATESRPADEVYSQALWRYFHKGKDRQARYFSLVALGQIGGDRNRNQLLELLHKARHLTKPWVALSLGVLAFDQAADDPGHPTLRTIGRALRFELAEANDPEARGAMAIALGLCRYREAAEDLRTLLEQYDHQDEFAGYLCLSLALMGDKMAVDQIQTLVQRSVRRPDRLKQAAVALGKLGDRKAAQLLHGILAAPDQNVAKLSAVATALSFIGDRRSLKPLRQMLQDPSLTQLSRAFAAVSLGGIGAQEDLPWNSKIAVDLNYRAAVETLTNQSSGILDIL